MEVHGFSLWIELSADANDALEWNADLEKVFKKLVQGMIGVTHNEDSLLAIIVKKFGENRADKRFSGTLTRR